MRNVPSNDRNGKLRSAEWFERQGPRRLPPPLVAQVHGCHGRDVPRAPGHRHLQQLERARQLQRPPARARRVGQARGAAGGRVPARVSGDVARRVADEADDDALPEPHGDGRRGVHSLLSARRCRAADRLRQDEPGEHHGCRERGHPVDRGDGRPDAERALARARDRLVQRLLALPRGASRRAHHRGRVGRDRELDVAVERALHDHGHGLDDGVRDRGARSHARGRSGDSGRRLAAAPARGNGRAADRGARRERPQAVRHPHARGVRERNPCSPRDLGLDERDPAPHRLRRSGRCRAAAAALRRAVRDDSLAGRPEARRAVPHGGLLLRRGRSGRHDADRRSVAPRRRHGLRPHGAGEHRRRGDHQRRGHPDAGRPRSTRAARSSCSAATSARTAR